MPQYIFKTPRTSADVQAEKKPLARSEPLPYVWIQAPTELKQKPVTVYVKTYCAHCGLQPEQVKAMAAKIQAQEQRIEALKRQLKKRNQTIALLKAP